MYKKENTGVQIKTDMKTFEVVESFTERTGLFLNCKKSSEQIFTGWCLLIRLFYHFKHQAQWASPVCVQSSGLEWIFLRNAECSLPHRPANAFVSVSLLSFSYVSFLHSFSLLFCLVSPSCTNLPPQYRPSFLLLPFEAVFLSVSSLCVPPCSPSSV